MIVGDKEDGEEETLSPRNGNGVPADDPVGLYFGQMMQASLLTSEEEIELAQRIEAGVVAREALESSPKGGQRQRAEWQAASHEAQAARKHLARANTRLVVSIAKRYMGQGLPFLDLIQEGNVGLMRAVDKYDYRRGNRFSTYATWWIRQSVSRAVAQKTRPIRIPLHMTDRLRQMYRTAQGLEQEFGRRPTPEEIAAEMDLPAQSVRDMMEMSLHTLELERPVGVDGDAEFGDLIEDVDAPEASDAAEHGFLREAIEEILDELTPRQARILRLRFGLNGRSRSSLACPASASGSWRRSR
jgi:RNA polymerase primary sigma factor